MNCPYCTGDKAIIDNGVNNWMFVDSEGEILVVADGKETMKGKVKFCPMCGRDFAKPNTSGNPASKKEPQRGDPIWYVDEDDCTIEIGKLFNINYREDGKVDSFSVDFENGDFDEFVGESLGVHFFFSEEEAVAQQHAFRTK